MKNILLLLTAFILASTQMMAQTVPEGMRYQAIARDGEGSLLQEKLLIVQVELLSAGSTEKVHFSEMHEVTSNQLGLLDFVIGEGTQSTGKFSDIPWSAEEMWVRISVKAKGEDNYQIISTGQLYSVPYAQYAETAGIVSGGNSNDGGSDSSSTRGDLDQTSFLWSLEGNFNGHKKDGGPPVLGTTDRKQLTIITNNIPRITIDWLGNINLFGMIDLNGDLNVDGNTTLNGSLTVANMSPTYFSGKLTVDKTTTLHADVLVANEASSRLTGSLDVDKTLNVDGATTINNALVVQGNSHVSGILTVDKATTLNDLTVANMSATQLTGSLDVDQKMSVDGATTLNNSLSVTNTSASFLSGILTVAKAVTLKDKLTVANAASTHMTGSLTVDGNVNVGSDINIDGPLEVINMHPSTLTGTLEVDKLTRMNAGLEVRGTSGVGPGGQYLAFFDNAEGGSSDGIAIRINNGDVSKENNYMTFYRGNSIAGRIEGYQIEDILDIPAPTGDEIWSAVCIGIADYNPLTLFWTQFAGAFNAVSYGWNNITIPSFDIPDIPAFAIPDVPALAIPDVPAFVISDVPAFVIPDVPGLVIPDVPGLTIGPLLCTNICFCDCCFGCFDFSCCCESVCLIPGSFTVWPAITIPDFGGIAIPDFPGIPIPDFPGIPIPDFPGIAIPDFPGLVIPAVPEINLKNLFGEAPTIPTFSDILISEGICPDIDLFDLQTGYIPKLAAWAYEHRLHSLISADPLKLVASALTWGLTTAAMENGVVYGSKGADYAEYLPKLYGTERFLKGEVVGVHNGKISKNTNGADQILAITSQPLVLGNMPDVEEGDAFEKVAFLGQIPVYVTGPVSLGDYIVASGKNDGTAIAISPASVTADMLSTVLGTAWSEYEGSGVTLINTSIGLRPAEITMVLQKQSDVEQLLQQQLIMQRDNTEVMSHDIEQLKIKLGLAPISMNNP